MRLDAAYIPNNNIYWEYCPLLCGFAEGSLSKNDSGVKIPLAKAGTAFKLFNLEVELVLTWRSASCTCLWMYAWWLNGHSHLFPGAPLWFVPEATCMVVIIGWSRMHTISSTCTFCAGFSISIVDLRWLDIPVTIDSINGWCVSGTDSTYVRSWWVDATRSNQVKPLRASL